MVCKIFRTEESPLLKNIEDALKMHKPKAKGIRIGITKSAENFKPDNEDKTYLVKWLCWSIIDSKKNDLTDPELCVAHADMSEDQLRIDLKRFFEGFKIIVDNEIHFDA